jgi:hypothetical protein
MSSEQPPTPAGPGPVPRGRREVVVRRAPKFVPFMAAGVVLGVVVAAVTALAGPESAEFTRGAVFGFFAVLFGLAGLLAGAVAALVLDRVGVKRAEHLFAEETGAAEETGTAAGTAGGPEGPDAQNPPERLPGA